MVEAALNKMLHPPTTRLRRMAITPALRPDLEQAIAALGDLFELGETVASQPLEAPASEVAEGAREDDPDGDPPRPAGVREAS